MLRLWRSVAAVWAWLALSLPAAAGVPEGIGWLSSQANANGSFGGATTSLATPVQSTAEALRAYQALGQQAQPPFNPALGFLNADTEVNTEFLVRKIVVNFLAGNDVSALVNTLVAHQNFEGGFGDQPGYDSSVFDTAYALEALAIARYSAGQVVPDAVGFLLSRQQANGGFAIGGNDTSVFVTAQAMRALWHYRYQYSQVPAALNKARDYLLASRDASGSWGESFNTALSLLALVPYLPDTTAVTNSISSLQAAQLANGSWGDDPYTTALALQALYLAGLPQPNPDYVTIKGKVVDGQTGLSLSGVTVTLSGAASASLVTQSDGAFEFLKLPAGSYNLQLTLANYATLSASTSGKIGQTLDFGVLTLVKSQSATTGTIKGTVTNGATGLPLGGVTVSTSGGASAVTGVDGQYQIANVPAGTVTVQASLAGYSLASGSGTITAGGTLVFSPALVPAAAAGTVIQGQITAAATNQPLAGAVIRINGVVQATTDANGNYSITNATPGTLTLSVELAGYDTVTAVGEVAANTTTVFSPKLYATNTTPPGGNTAGVQGVVLDAGSGAPLAGVTIQTIFGGSAQNIVTGADGRFSLTGLSATVGTLTFSLANYASTSLSVTLAPLATLDVGEVRLRKLDAVALLPDLVVQAVDTLPAINDPNTLRVSGTLNATVANAGTANVSGPVQVMAFYDANQNGRFDSGVDLTLGQAELGQGLVVGATQALAIPLSGELPFRDAPISVWVDSGQTVAESNELNNVASSLAACQVPLEPFDLTDFTDIAVNSKGIFYVTSDITNFFTLDISTGALTQVYTDTAPDGYVNSSTAYAGIAFASNAPGNVLFGYEIQGTDDIFRYDIDAGFARTRSYFGIISGYNSGRGDLASSLTATADSLVYGLKSCAGCIGGGTSSAPTNLFAFKEDGSRFIDIGPVALGGNGIDADALALSPRYGLLAFELKKSNGVTISSSLISIDRNTAQASVIGQPLNGRDLRGAVFDHADRLWVLDAANNEVLQIDPATGAIVGTPLKLYRTGTPSGATRDLTASRLQVVDRGPGQGLDLSLRVGNVMSSSGPVSWWPGEGNTDDIADSNPGISEGSVAYAPGKIGQAFQFNGTNQIRVPNAPNLRVSQDAFTVEAWVKFDALRDSVTTANGDMSIFDTITGGINVDGWRLAKQADNRFWFCFGAGSNHCYDPAYTVFSTTRATTGVFYHVVAVKTATHFAIYVNGNREDIRALPPSFVDSQMSDLLIGGNAVEGAHLIGLIDEPKIYNRALSAEEILAAYNGTAGTSPTEVSFYDGDPAAGGAVLGSTVVNAIPANGYRDIVFNTTAALSGRDIYAVVDPNNRVNECRENNNSVHISVATAAKGAVTASTDKSAYGPNSPVILQGLALNTGTLTATYSIELQVEDGNGVLVQGFAPQAVANLASGYTATVTNNWNTGTLLAGNYRLRAILRDPQGKLLAQHTTAFTIGINEPNCGQPTVNMLVTTASIPGNDPAHLTPVLRFKFEGTGSLTALSSIPAYPETLVNDPIYAAFSSQNELFISNRHGNVAGTPGSIARFKFDADGNFIANGAVTGNSLEAVHGVAFSPNGELFAVNFLNSTISRFKFDLAGNAIPNGVVHSGTPNAQGLAFSSGGELFVTDSGGGGKPGVQRWRFDPASGSPIANGFISWPGAVNPHGLGFSPNGELFVADLAGNRVYRFRFDNAGNAVANGSITASTPIGIAFSPAGELFVTSHYGGGLSRFLFDQNGNAVPNGVIPMPTLGGIAIKPVLQGTGNSCIATATTKVTTDKQVYEAWDTVNISGRVQNPASNAVLAPTRVEITVRSPAGQALFTESRALGQLTPLALRDLSYTLPLADVATGSYPVELVLKDVDTGDVLSTATTSFQVLRREIQALAGSVAVTSAQVYQGDANRCTETAKNVSGTAIAGVRLVHQLINANVGTVINEVTETVDLAAGGVIHNYFRDISTAGLAVGNYSCVIKADLNGDSRVLAFGGFQVLEPPIKVSAALSLGARGRLLVLLDNNRCETREAEKRGGEHEKRETSSDKEDEDHHKNGSSSALCDRDLYGSAGAPVLSVQRTFLEQLLKSAGWSYTIVETADDFTREFYSGGYVAYALFSEREKLAEDTQKALREAVFRGDGLFVAGAHDARNLHSRRLQEALGVKLIGHVSHAAGIQLTESPLALAGIIDLFLGDKALRIKRLTASSAASYLLGGPAHDENDPEDCCDSSRRYEEGKSAKDKDERDECEGRPDRYLDALTLNIYGQGKSALAGMDLLATAARDGEQSLAAQLLLQALTHIHPAAIHATPRGVAPIALRLTNQGIATPVRATISLPQGVTVVDPTEASVQNNVLTWNTALAVNETKTLVVYLRLPDTAGALTLKAQVEAPIAGAYSLVAEPNFTINVESLTSATIVRQMIEAANLQLPKAQAHALGEALEHIRHAEKYLATNLPKALHEVLKAADALVHDTSAEVFPIRLEIARWVREITQGIGG